MDSGASGSANEPSATSRRRFRLRLRGRSVAFKAVSGLVGMAMVGGAAYGVTSWVVGLAAGSSGEGQSANVSNLTISAVATPSASNQLFPGGTGDVVATITNPNSFPVTVTGVNLPANTVFANGYTTSSLATTQTGCLSTTPSDVTWNFATATSGTAHTLTTPLTVAANGTLAVTFTNDATMTSGAPAACEGTFFSLPSLTGIAASGGAATATTSPVTDSWTS
ncbi:MAG: hypothetical protein WCA31_05115 [Acidimicrobiales bacterium]